MKSETLNSEKLFVIDNVHKYRIDHILEGGMGLIFLMTKIENYLEIFEDKLFENPIIQDKFKYPYLKTLAAKSIKYPYLSSDFQRECLLWLNLDEKGIVPLLKVININNCIYALMPRYEHDFRTLINNNKLSPISCIKLFEEPINGLSNIYNKMGVIHQDIKPENFLVDTVGKLYLSDWGIANLQSKYLASNLLNNRKFIYKSMQGFGTLPYMAPERFYNAPSSCEEDIFSLGIIFFEIFTGRFPYINSKPVESQIISGDYYFYANKLLENLDRKLSNLILSLIHPLKDKRISDYKYISKFIKSL